jgi:O-antigen biosynthesis protein
MFRQHVKTYLLRLFAALQQPNRLLILLIKAYRLWTIGGATALALRLRASNHRPFDDRAWQTYRQTLQRTTFRHAQRLLAPSPTIAIVLTSSATTMELSQTIQAVIDQIYPHWQLYIIESNIVEPHVIGSKAAQEHDCIGEFARHDRRIKIEFLPPSHPETAVTKLLSQISAPFTVLIHAHQLLEKQTLLRIATAINADNPDIIYADEAIVAGNALRSLVLRPMFSLEYLRSNPDIAPPIGFKTDLLRAIGGLDPAWLGQPDYDLTLRAVEAADCIVHIPEILNLTRWLSPDAEQIKATTTRNQAALIRHLDRCQQSATVTCSAFNMVELQYALRPDLKVAIIIPTRNCGHLVKICLDSIKSTVTQVNYDIVLIDHASDELVSLEYFNAIANEHKVLRYQGDFNFSVINNWAVAQLDDSYSHFLFCNNDIEAIAPGWLERMLGLGQQPDIGIVGAKLIYPDRLIQHAGMVLGLKGASEHSGRFMAVHQPDQSPTPGYLGALVVNREVSAVTAACLLMRRDAWMAVNGFDDGFAVGFGDTDLCLRTQQAGYRVVFCGQATLIHHESYTRGKSDGWRDPHPADSARFITRWQDLLRSGDPYYNPNLSHFNCDWAVKPPLTIPQPQRRVYRTRRLPSPSHRLLPCTSPLT